MPRNESKNKIKQAGAELCQAQCFSSFITSFSKDEKLSDEENLQEDKMA